MGTMTKKSDMNIRMACVVARKLSYQFPDCREGRLMAAVLTQAILDLFDEREMNSAINHLKGRIWEAEVCGVSADWIRSQLNKAGVYHFET